MSEPLAPPQDIAAEQAVLGACLHSPRAYEAAKVILSDEDWYRPAHLAVWELMRRVEAAGGRADPVTVNSALMSADADIRRMVDTVLIASIYGSPGTAGNVDYYAQKIAEAGLRRRLIDTATGVIQRAHETENAADAAEWAATEMMLARDTQQTSEATDVDINDLLVEDIRDEWVIPGLLARGDRLILTASEGLGKSTLLRQIAVMTAAGLHPFTTENIRPMRVLVVDCENGRKLSRDRYKSLIVHTESIRRPVEDRLRIDIRPSGLDLQSPGDSSLLLRMVERTRPDLLLIGPIYRLHEDDPNDEKAARRVTVALDRARAVSGCAVITEAHTPHSDGPGGHMLRPFGSSLWKRWPEFGYCLKLAQDSDYNSRLCKLVPWRGPRDERDWPVGLRAGGEWPWTPVSTQLAKWAS